MMPMIRPSHHASFTSLVANARMMSSIPLNSRYQPMNAASIANVPPGRKNAMQPVMTKTAPRMPCSQRQPGAVNALNSSASPATRITIPASTLIAATDRRSNRSTIHAMTNQAAPVTR